MSLLSLRRFLNIPLYNSIHSAIIYIFPGFLAGVLIYCAYLFTHHHPALDGGLFLLISEIIKNNNYVPPTKIPLYTENGIPFSYPPLMFYVVAILMDKLHIDGTTISLYLPGIFILLYIISFYFLSMSILKSKFKSSIAIIVVATAPEVFRTHIDAGGIVRAPSYLFAIFALYTITKVYSNLSLCNNNPKVSSYVLKNKYVVLCILFLSLTILTHPITAAFVFFSYLFFAVFYSNNLNIKNLEIKLIKYRLIVLFFILTISIILTSVWWVWVIKNFGTKVFLQAANTHRGIGNIIYFFGWLLLLWPPETKLVSFWHVLILLGAFYLIASKRHFLPAWLVYSAFFVGHYRYLFLIGSLIATEFISEFKNKIEHLSDTKFVITLFLIWIYIFSTLSGVLYVSGYPKPSWLEDPLPSTINNNDISVMKQLKNETAIDSKFLVLGRVAEWFPYYSHRTIIVSPWGTEWSGKWKIHSKIYRETFKCSSVTDIDEVMSTIKEEFNSTPDYIYIQKSTPTWKGLAENLKESKKYQLFLENERVSVFKIKYG